MSNRVGARRGKDRGIDFPRRVSLFLGCIRASRGDEEHGEGILHSAFQPHRFKEPHHAASFSCFASPDPQNFLAEFQCN